MLQERNCPRPPPTELTRRISYYASACPSGAFLGQAPSPEIDFIPEPVRDRLRFFSELTGCLHLQDRVGTYGSTLLAEVL